MAARADTMSNKSQGWPRIHFVYFALATLDVLAIIAGLLLSHRVITSYELGLERTAQFERGVNLLRNASDLLAETQTDVAAALYSVNVSFERSSFLGKINDARGFVERVPGELSDLLPEKAGARFSGLLLKAQKSIDAVEKNGMMIFSRVEGAEPHEAAMAMRQTSSRYVSLRYAMRDLNQYLVINLAGLRQADHAALDSLRTYEYLLGGLVVFIILCVVAYGHYVGALMKRKFTELQLALGRSEAAEKEATSSAASLRDINDEIVRLNNDLSRNMKALGDAQEELVRKGRMEQLGQLTATIAHELRNPLGTVRTSAFLLERRISGKGLGVETQFERINKGIVRCDNIITQLLDFSRTRQLNCQSGDLDSWLEQVLEEESKKLPAVVTVSCDLGLGGLMVPFDPSRLQRAIVNLLNNASEALVGQGDDPAKFATATPEIHVATRISGNGVGIDFMDNGPGIAADILQHIREPLFTTKSFGTGLGVPAIEQIAHQHGGRLDISSTEGRGATFTVWLPMTAKAGVAA